MFARNQPRAFPAPQDYSKVQNPFAEIRRPAARAGSRSSFNLAGSRSRFRVLLDLAAVISLVSVALLFWFPRKPAQSPEVHRSELTLSAGRLYRQGETSAFTGWLIEPYPEGARKSRSRIVNGVLHGLSEGWHTNGQLQVREHFRSGVSHGVRERWHLNGSKMSEVTIVEGKLDGTFRRWHENGKLAEEIQIRQGAPDGLSLAYYPSGFLKARARLANGKVLETNSWKDGELKEAAVTGKN